MRAGSASISACRLGLPGTPSYAKPARTPPPRQLTHNSFATFSETSSRLRSRSALNGRGIACRWQVSASESCVSLAQLPHQKRHNLRVAHADYEGALARLLRVHSDGGAGFRRRDQRRHLIALEFVNRSALAGF